MDNVYIIKPDGTKKLLCSTGLSGSMKYHKLTIKLNDAGSMEVHIPASNARQEGIDFLMDEITFERKGVELFRGEATNKVSDILNTGEITAKGAMNYFDAVYMEPYSFSGTIEEYMTLLLDHFNGRVLANRRIYLGVVTVTDSNNYIVRSNTDRVKISKLLSEKLVNSLGGYMRVRVDEGVKYLDYLADFTSESSQRVTYHGNIVDISQEVEYGDVYTVIIPTGATVEETGSALTIESVNDGNVYYADEEAVAKYGWREMTYKWEDVTLPENLFSKAKAALAAYTNPVKSVDVKAVDLSLKTDDIDSFYLGDNITCESEPNGISDTYLLTAMELYALSPENEQLTLGGEKPTTTTVSSDISQLKEQTSTMQKSNWDLSNRIANADGLYTTEVEQDDGSVISYFHNRPSLADSNLQISFSSVGIFLTADHGETWYGMEMDGDTIVKVLEASGIKADVIQGGTLTLGGVNNGNGRERIYDKDGNLILTINNLGIRAFSKDDTTAVTAIDGDGVTTKNFIASENIQMGNMKIIPRKDGGVTFQKANVSASDIIKSVVTEPEDVTGEEVG